MLLISLILLAGCGEAKKVPVEQPQETVVLDSTAGQNTFIDTRDGKTYKYVIIGEQVWMAENLNYEAEGSRCYNDSISYCDKYGRLYKWKSAIKVCPSGWLLPIRPEWDNLVATAGGVYVAGEKLKVKSGWYENGNGTDDYGFSALPGGGHGTNGFFNVGYLGYWWTASDDSSGNAYFQYMDYLNRDTDNDDGDKSYLFSVRCVLD
ncbi:MAG: fibrobacter succinogenes major paralogous domain-containing protein [Fibromonadaceae bacterium]|nr:fibrobacter succinogenes major paralogous domain-containing protein [Fibromonadaceae bacterium]